MFSIRPVLKLLALFAFLLPSSSVVFAEQQEDDENATLMTNYNALREEGQGFFLIENSLVYENPGSLVSSFVSLYWSCDLEFLSDDADTTNYGYVGR